jgi:MFS family permease
MLVTFQIATTSGIAVAYFVGAALAPTESWRLILSLSAIPAVIVLILIVRLPDTARWLLMNGRREEAADLLRRVEPDMDPDEEVQRIEHDLSYEEKGGASPSSSRDASVRPASSSLAWASWYRSLVSTPSSTTARRSSRRSASRARRARSSRPASSRLLV